MARSLAVFLFILIIVPLVSAQAPETVRLSGGGTFEVIRYHNPPPGADVKNRIRGLRSVVIAPVAVVIDSETLTELIGLIRERTGWRVLTPGEFIRAATQLVESSYTETGLTEEELDAVARRVGQKLEADAAILIRHGVGEVKVQALPLLLIHRIEQTGVLRLRLVAVSPEVVLWSQRMDYRITVRGVISFPQLPPASEVAAVSLRRMVERFLSEAWHP